MKTKKSAKKLVTSIPHWIPVRDFDDAGSARATARGRIGFFGQRSAFFGQPFIDLCFGIEIRASDDALHASKNLQSL
jgi:hypothetical protein